MTKLTKSQQTAIEQQKRVFSRIYPDAVYTVRKPRNIDKVRLIAEYASKNCLGGTNQQAKAWTIGKRGKIED